MNRRFVVGFVVQAALALLTLALPVEASDLVRSTSGDRLFVLHMDFNTLCLKREAIVNCLRTAAASGYNAILWEIEDKIRLETCRAAVHPEAMPKSEFREILAEADRLGLEPIPLLQTFGHAEYVLQRGDYGKWKELPSAASCYCASNPEVRRFLKAMVHEYLDLFGDKVRNFHLGGDEAWAFGKCPVCSKRNRMELYAEHLNAVSEELVSRGIKPGIWCDMILASSEDETSRIPRSFTVWHWDYGYNGRGDRTHAWSGKTDVLKKLGFEIVFAPSTSSWGDGPFLPRFRTHGENVAAAADYARKEGFRGLCVTSWSCRKVPKSLQKPMWELAGKRYLNPGEDSERDFAEAFARHFGDAKVETLKTLTDWPGEFVVFDGTESYPGLKCGKPAPKGDFMRIIEERRKDDPNVVEKLIGTAEQAEKRVRAALSETRTGRPGPGTGELVEGAELTLAYLYGLGSALRGTCCSTFPEGRTAKYFAAEQSGLSATNSAAVVWSVLKDAPCRSEGAVEIARRGESAGRVIVIPAEASDSVRHAAEELRSYVGKVTGVLLPVVDDTKPLSGPSILLGETRHSERTLGSSLGIDALGPDGFRISVRTPHVLILGSSERGVLYGTYEFLERYAGCRWYSSWFEVAPPKDRIEVPRSADIVERPAFDMREPFWYDVTEHPEFAARLKVNARSWRRTEARHGGEPWRFGGGLPSCHTFDALLPPAQHFDAHPEYFAMIDGRRIKENTQLCLSNPDVLKLVTAHVLERIAADPGARFYGVSQNDNTHACECPACAAIDEEEGSHSGTIIRFVNALAAEVEKRNPNAQIETLAYKYSRKPPKLTRPRRNVVVCLCPIECDLSTPLDRSKYKENVSFMSDLDGWSRLTDRLYIWDYTTDYNDYPCPFPNVTAFQGNLRCLRGKGVRYVFAQGDNHGRHADFGELKAWLLAKLMWNPDLPAGELVVDFMKGYYGAAAPEVMRYFKRLYSLEREYIERENGNAALRIYSPVDNPALDDAFYSWAADVWRKAERAVKDDPERSYNVRMGAFSVDYVRMTRNQWILDFTGKSANDRTDYVALARSMLARMDEAGDIRLSEILGKHTMLVTKWKSVASGEGRMHEPCAGGYGEIEDKYVMGWNPGVWFKAGVSDLDAEDGRAIRINPAQCTWTLYFDLDQIRFSPGRKYALKARIRVDRSGDDGEAFWCGVHDGKTGRGCCKLSPAASETTDRYRWYELGVFEPTATQKFWIGPGRFRPGERSAVNAVYLDKIAFREE